MQLHIENFGPIKNGTIDLNKQLYVFVGYNNSGKTYLSQLIWDIFANKQNLLGTAIDTVIANKNIVWADTYTITEDFIADVLTEFQNQLKAKITSTLYLKNDDAVISNAKFSFVELENVAQDVLKKIINTPYKELSDILALPNNVYVEYTKPINSATITTIEVNLPKDVSFHALEYGTPPKFVELGYTTISAGIGTPESFFKDTLKHLINNAFLSQTNTLFMPSERLFYTSKYDYMYGIEREKNDLLFKLLSNKDDNADLKNRAQNLTRPNYTQAIQPIIKLLLNFNRQNAHSYYQQAIEDLEGIINGRITARRSESIALAEFVLTMKNNNEVPMYLASSSVNQLSSLYLYLKYWAREQNNFLIIDEPEENLHPQNQLKLTDLLLQFGQMNNNRLLITTHSPLITEHINNYLILGTILEQMSETEARNAAAKLEIDYLPLTHQDVGIYFFTGTEIQEYTIDDYGTIFRDFKRATDEVKSTAQELASILFDHRNPELA
jgi:AAA15 family ATPase/GTPase